MGQASDSSNRARGRPVKARYRALAFGLYPAKLTMRPDGTADVEIECSGGPLRLSGIVIASGPDTCQPGQCYLDPA